MDNVKKDYNLIDLTRFFCAILVVMIHIPPLGDYTLLSSPVLRFTNYWLQNFLARIAVPYFFITNGFFLYSKLNMGREKVYEYISRLIRIYIIWSMIYLPFKCQDLTSQHSGWTILLIYLRDFIFSGSYFHLWYITALIFSTALIAFLYKYKVSFFNILLISMSLYIFGLLGTSYFGLIRPLEELSPALWNMLKLYKDIFVTARNGLFDGFLYVSIGMLFAKYNIKISNITSAFWVTVFLMLMLTEAIWLKLIGFMYTADLYLFLPFVSFFFFNITKNNQVNDRKKFIKLRECSSLVFYLHMFIYRLLCLFMGELINTFKGTPLLFILTIVSSIAVSLFIIYIADKWKWLKKIYL